MGDEEDGKHAKRMIGKAALSLRLPGLAKESNHLLAYVQEQHLVWRQQPDLLGGEMDQVWTDRIAIHGADLPRASTRSWHRRNGAVGQQYARTCSPYGRAGASRTDRC